MSKALNGDLRAAFAVATMLLKGDGGAPKDPAAALDWFRRCADAGDSRAQTQVGYMYAEGVGVARDTKLALQWWLRAAYSGNPNAQFNIAILYLRGDGVPADFPRALKWLSLAADKGSPQAQMDLALLYSEGRAELPRDPALAMRWMRTAAGKKYLCAEYNLGVFYLRGIGTAPNPVEARRWFDKAANHVSHSGQLMDVAQRCGMASSDVQTPPQLEADGALSK